jgi:hypothetical protein
MSDITNEKLNRKLNSRVKGNPAVREFTVTERYAGTKNLSDIFADLLYAEYRRKGKSAPAAPYPRKTVMRHDLTQNP